MNFSGTAQEQVQQAVAFEKFIKQDDYLSDNRGSYMERYGAVSPWRGKWDVKIIQDFVVEHTKDFTNVLNAVSPAFTCSFAFAKYVVDEIGNNQKENQCQIN